MKQADFLKEVFDYLDAIKKPFQKRQEIETLRWYINMIEDCLPWEKIEKHLKEGCSCEVLKGEEGKKALETELKESFSKRLRGEV